jgi:Protein of unknown function (DUF3592)
MTTVVYGLPYIAWCGILALVVIGGLGIQVRNKRNAMLARPVPGRILWVTHSSSPSGRVQSVMAEVAGVDALGKQLRDQPTLRVFPDGETGGVWTGRELTMWQLPGAKAPRLNRPTWSKRGLISAASALAVLVIFVDVHVAGIDPNSPGVLKPLGAVFAAYFAIAAVICLIQLANTRQILRGTPATGQILGLVRHTTTNQDNTTSTTYQPIVGFTTADGKHVLGLTKTTGSYRKRWTGRTVQVRHEPDHPEVFRLAKPSEARVPVFNFLTCLLLIAAGIAMAAYGMRY